MKLGILFDGEVENIVWKIGKIQGILEDQRAEKGLVIVAFMILRFCVLGGLRV